MDEALNEIRAGLLLFVAFFGVCFALFGIFRFWEVFIRPKKIIKKHKKTIDKCPRRVYNDNRK